MLKGYNLKYALANIVNIFIFKMQNMYLFIGTSLIY